MSFLGGGEHKTPKCWICDVFFKTWQEKRDHDSALHDRYQSTDNQHFTWNNSGGRPERNEKDYFVCGDHGKKLNEDFRCPVESCTNSNFMRKSLFLIELRNKVPEI